MTIEITNHLGQRLKQYQKQQLAIHDQLDVSDLKPGMYFLSIRTDKFQKAIAPFVITR